jgi:ABC-type branched-subunit amino acid transport system substrate-binding protein
VPLIAPAATAAAAAAPAGRYVLRYGLTNVQQARAVAQYAVEKLNAKRFVVLYPNNAYGRELSRLFIEDVRQRDGELIALETYEPHATDFGPQLRRIKTADLAKYGLLGPPPAKRGQVQTYTPGFDAVFIPGDYDEAALIASQLAFYDIQNVALLGANGWGSEELVTLGGRYVDGGVFVDGFFAGSADPAVRAFTQAYRSRYQAEPTLLAAQGYDAARLVLAALRAGADSGEKVHAYLAALKEFRGATGYASMSPEGELVRTLFFIQVKNGRFVEIH